MQDQSIMQVTGALKMKGATKKISDKFKSREFVVTDASGQFPQYISFVLTQGRCDLLDDYHPGEIITVSFNVRGRQWTSPSGEVKYFNALEAWKIQAAPSAQGSSQDHDENGIPF